MTEKERLDFEFRASDGTGVILSGYSKESFLLLEVARGIVTVSVGTESVECNEGDYVYVPQHLVYRVTSEARATIHSLCVPCELVTSNMEKIDTELFYMFYVQSRNRISVFGPEHPIYESLAYSMSEAGDEFAAKDIGYRLSVLSSAYLIISAILRHYSGSRDSLDRMLCHNVMRLRPAIDYITEHCGEKIYVDTLSEMIEVSADYFTKMFKESIGKTPIDYINTVRVNKALELLAVTDTPINEIAEKSGFANANYFHKIFKQYMNTSPLTYRKSAAT